MNCLSIRSRREMESLAVLVLTLAAVLLVAPTSRAQGVPRLVIAGDSTAANDGTGGPIGWGVVLPEYFASTKIEVLNLARAGRSSRTFYTEGLWQGVLDKLRVGDVVLIQFGHNDGGLINDDKRARGSLPGLGMESQEIDNLQTKKHETVHTFGWYMRRMIDDAKAKALILHRPVSPQFAIFGRAMWRREDPETTVIGPGWSPPPRTSHLLT